MKILIGVLLTFAVGTDLSQVLIPETCEHVSREVICANIKTVFPEADYSYGGPIVCNNCSIKVFSINTFPFPFRTFEYFNVSASHIENVTSMAFSNFTNYNIIYLHENDIANVSANAFYGSELSELHLHHNKLVELTPGFMNHLSANVVTMYSNKLRHIPEDVFRGIIYASSIDLSFNEIESLYTDSFRHLTTLKYLYLQHNKLKLFPSGVFKHMPNLMYLDLSNNKLLALPVAIFTHTTGLTNLNLAGNNLRGLPLGIFSWTNSLTNLNVSSNKLFYNFDMNVLLPTQITTLDVSENSLGPEHFKMVHLIIPSLGRLGLNGNFWECDDLIQTIRYLKSYSIDVIRYTSDRYNVTNIYGITCHEHLQEYLELEKATKNDL